jgi:hypothetical protein
VLAFRLQLRCMQVKHVMMKLAALLQVIQDYRITKWPHQKWGAGGGSATHKEPT